MKTYKCQSQAPLLWILCDPSLNEATLLFSGIILKQQKQRIFHYVAIMTHLITQTKPLEEYMY